MQNAKHVVQVTTTVSTRCEHCEKWVDSEDFQGSVNHYIEQHGYKLLHVGQETTRDMDGKPWHSTVAVLGHE